LLLLLTFSFALSIAFGFLIIHILKNPALNQAPSDQKISEIPPLIIGENNYWLGAANPKVTIVEFADFACPFCKTSFPSIRELGLKYRDDVKIIFRDFPVIAEHSKNLALAARCAGEQGLFWIMHDKLYLNQNISTDQQIKQLTKEIGANEEKFNICYDKKKYLTQIEKDYLDGQALGITGTPTWFINGQKISGDIPFEKFDELINNILTSK